MSWEGLEWWQDGICLYLFQYQDAYNDLLFSKYLKVREVNVNNSCESFEVVCATSKVGYAVITAYVLDNGHQIPYHKVVCNVL